MHVQEISERYGLLLEAYLRGCGQHRAELNKQVIIFMFIYSFSPRQL